MIKELPGRKLLSVAVCIACSGFATFTSADDYFGGNVGFVEYSESGISGDASLTTVYGRLGKQFNEFLSGEVRVGVGVGDDSVNVYGESVDVELESMYGLYVRGGFNATERVYPYAIFGYTRGELKASLYGTSVSDSESDVSFGVGLDVKFTDEIKGNFEYINYLDKNEAEISGFAFGVVKTF